MVAVHRHSELELDSVTCRICQVQHLGLMPGLHAHVQHPCGHQLEGQQ